MKRIQRKRTKGWKKPPDTVYVGRGTRYGNPFTIAEYGREGAIAKYREYWKDIRARMPLAYREDIAALRRKNLMCFCSLDQPCHADVLLELVAELERETKRVQP